MFKLQPHVWQARWPASKASPTFPPPPSISSSRRRRATRGHCATSAALRRCVSTVHIPCICYAYMCTRTMMTLRDVYGEEGHIDAFHRPVHRKGAPTPCVYLAGPHGGGSAALTLSLTLPLPLTLTLTLTLTRASRRRRCCTACVWCRRTWPPSRPACLASRRYSLRCGPDLNPNTSSNPYPNSHPKPQPQNKPQPRPKTQPEL